MVYSSAIGIDLGTTNTVVGILQDGRSHIIPNRESQSMTPSLVYYNPRTLKASVGRVAEDQCLTCPRNFMFDTKRIIGRHYDDFYVQKFVEQENDKMLKVVRSTKSEAHIELQVNDQSQKVVKSCEEISADLLKYIRQSVNEYIGHDVKDAVVSVPAYFSYAQRAATKRAAELAGFNVLKLITEPVAAAIEYTFKNQRKPGNVLMFDLGGGTLDLSIITLTEGNFTVKCIEGDIFLGGRDFDDEILEFLKLQLATRRGMHGINRDTKRSERFIHRLRKHAMRFKEMLSTVEEYLIVLELDKGGECEITFTKTAFETLCEELFKKIEDKVIQCLESAKMQPTDINNVVLVGGSSKIPKVVEILSRIFKHIKLSTDINKDEAVARGAAIHAALLKNELDKSQMYKITEVAPFTVGIQSKHNLMSDIIKKGTPLPFSGNLSMNTTENNQQKVEFEIYEGERKNCLHNNRIGGFSLNDIPPRKAGEVELDVTLALDENGLLVVSAKETSTGIENRLQIAMQNLTLCARAPFVSLEEERRLAADDELYDRFFRLRLQAETFCQQTMYDVEQANLSLGDVIKDYCQTFLKIIESMDYKEYNSLRGEFTNLMKKINQVFQNHERSVK